MIPIDYMTDDELYYYTLGSDNFLCFHEGWDWTFERYTSKRVWISEDDLNA